MKLISILFITFGLLAMACKKPSHQRQEIAIDHLIVKFKDTATQAEIDSFGVDIGLQKVKDIPELNIKVYKLVLGMSMDKAIQKCQKNPCVQYAEPDYQVRALAGKKEHR